MTISRTTINSLRLLSLNSSAPIDAILDFWQCCLQNLTTYFEKDLKKYCTYDQKEQLFFKYFSIRILDFEETFAEDIVCSALGADELSTVMYTLMEQNCLTVL